MHTQKHTNLFSRSLAHSIIHKRAQSMYTNKIKHKQNKYDNRLPIPFPSPPPLFSLVTWGTALGGRILYKGERLFLPSFLPSFLPLPIHSYVLSLKYTLSSWHYFIHTGTLLFIYPLSSILPSILILAPYSFYPFFSQSHPRLYSASIPLLNPFLVLLSLLLLLPRRSLKNTSLFTMHRGTFSLKLRDRLGYRHTLQWQWYSELRKVYRNKHETYPVQIQAQNLKWKRQELM